MFTIPRPNVIESDEGFSVEVLGRTGVRYTAGTRTLIVDSEVLMTPAGLVVYPSSISTWEGALDGDEIDDGTRHAIVDDIRRAFLFRGLEIVVQ